MRLRRRQDLLVASEALFRTMFAVDCRTLSGVVSISPAEHTERYGGLVLPPGAPHGIQARRDAAAGVR